MKRHTVRRGLKLLERAEVVEAALWRRFRFGGEASCRDKLFDRYRSFARQVARSEYRRRPNYGLDCLEFEQLAYQGLLEALDRFDPLRGSLFEPFARPRIRGAIHDGVVRSSDAGAEYDSRKRRERERVRSLLEHAGSLQGEPVDQLCELVMGLAVGFLAEQEADRLESIEQAQLQENSWEDSELRLSILSAVERLPEAEKQVLVQHYFHGVAFKTIATLMGLSPARVSQLHAAALTQLRGRLSIYE